jgi:hypothetical protein
MDIGVHNVSSGAPTLAGAFHSISSRARAQILCDSTPWGEWLNPVSEKRVLHNVIRGAGRPSEALHSVAGGESSEVLHRLSSGALAHD